MNEPITSVSIEPIGDRIVIVDLDRSDELAPGIVRPDTVEDERVANRGLVVAVGPGKLLDDGTRRHIEDVCVGDVVHYAQFTGARIKTPQGDYKIIGEGSIVARDARV